MAQQFDFLTTYIERLLDAQGFEALTEQTRAQYVPQFVAEAQRRLGLAVIPKLSEAHAKELATLIESGQVSQEELETFWKTAVPDFESVVKETMDAFAKEVATTLAAIR